MIDIESLEAKKTKQASDGKKLSELLASKKETAQASGSIDESFRSLNEATNALVSHTQKSIDGLIDEAKEINTAVSDLKEYSKKLADKHARDHANAIEKVSLKAGEEIDRLSSEAENALFYRHQSCENLLRASKKMVSENIPPFSVSRLFGTFPGTMLFVLMLFIVLVDVFSLLLNFSALTDIVKGAISFNLSLFFGTLGKLLLAYFPVMVMFSLPSLFGAIFADRYKYNAERNLKLENFIAYSISTIIGLAVAVVMAWLWF